MWFLIEEVVLIAVALFCFYRLGYIRGHLHGFLQAQLAAKFVQEFSWDQEEIQALEELYQKESKKGEQP